LKCSGELSKNALHFIDVRFGRAIFAKSVHEFAHNIGDSFLWNRITMMPFPKLQCRKQWILANDATCRDKLTNRRIERDIQRAQRIARININAGILWREGQDLALLVFDLGRDKSRVSPCS